MDPTQNALFALAEQRLAWADERQALLAQNVADAGVPGYRPRDMRPFAQVLGTAQALLPWRTAPGHLGEIAGTGRQSESDRPAAISPDGNGVALDQQLTKVAETQVTQRTVATIYKRYFEMFAVALGNGAGGQ